MKLKKNKISKIILIISVLILGILLSACSNNNSDTQNVVSKKTSSVTSTNTNSNTSKDIGTAIKEIAPGGSLVIPTAEISGTAKFYTIKVDGVTMEVLAVKASDGTIRTAFNTCQVCYDSGRGYYEQQGDKLVCQNCGNRFAMNRVEVEAGGCNPWPIFNQNKTVTNDSITISYDFLKASSNIFDNWKTSY